jgi:hypothetical protein
MPNIELDPAMLLDVHNERTRQRNPLTIARESGGKVEIDHQTYEEHLAAMPPALHMRDRFAMGEPINAVTDTYYCFWFDRGSRKYYVVVRNLREFAAMPLESLRDTR